MDNQFYTNNFANYLQFALSFVKDEEAAKDIVQNTFISYWHQEENFSNEYTVKSFFYKSIRNACLNHIRHLKVQSDFYGSFASDWESNDYFMEAVIRQEARAVLFEELEHLSDTGREVMLLSIEGFSNEEIADKLQISINTVKTHKARSYAKLRKNLAHLRMLLFLLGI